MSFTGDSAEATDEAEAGFIAALGERKVARSGEVFDRAVAVWSGSVTARPAIVVACETVKDVQDAVRIASRFHIPLSVRGGGHDWAGRSIREGGAMLDLTRMNGVKIAGGIAIVGGGATSDDLLAAAHSQGLTAATGTVGTVGFAGLTLGGGYGRLMGRYGLAADNLVGAQVVLAEGRIVETDESREPDLFWALRGGGGNFGVVTELHVRLHPGTEITTGFLGFPLPEADGIVRRWRDVAKSAPNELAAMFGAMSGPDGKPFLFMGPSWSGDADEGILAIDSVRRLGTPFLDTEDRGPIAQVVRSADALFPGGRHYVVRTRTLSEFTDDAIDTLLAGARAIPSAFSALNVHHFHGAAARVNPAATAFGLRDEHFLVEIIAAWDEPGNGTAHLEWMERTAASLDPYALPGGYANLLGPDDQPRADHAYGKNAARLIAAKQAYDPDGVFDAIPLPRGTELLNSGEVIA